ncbi:hypothetical protein IV203_025232 [Nitzschia inconspicua]|uniref:Uncharacterized protein n=1 Tax=Nitzschia inconspicua TaxID=303405 RepID=A0A9K3LHY2_9STRA|nr:hypothetical protein IV203_024758 [Nitzschia inconspicua]KAG7362348.1 hypothetical protein IV203_025232 [Nitzschia inconspicua]
MLMGPLMAGINGHKVRGKNATSAYENVFGMPLHEPLECDPALLRQCFTVRERLNLLPDPEFEASLQEYYIIDGDPEDPTDYYFEAGSECGDNSEDDSEDDSERTSSREDDTSSPFVASSNCLISVSFFALTSFPSAVTVPFGGAVAVASVSMFSMSALSSVSRFSMSTMSTCGLGSAWDALCPSPSP